MALLTLAFVGCERFKAPKPAPVYHYVEPEENIAELIWNCLKTQHPEVRPVIEAAKRTEQQGYMAEEKAAKFLSKTSLDYEYYTEVGEYPGEEYDSPLYAHYQLYCYQTLDNSWVGIVIKDIGGQEISKNNEQNLFIVEYQSDTLIDRTINTMGPESFEVATNVSRYQYDESLVFDTVSIAFITQKFWPMKFNWNGSAFEQDSETVYLENSIDPFRGTFYTHDAGHFFLDMDNKNVGEYLIVKGDTLAHFTYRENSWLSEYTVMSPKCGFAQTIGHIGNHSTVTSKPIAIGYPIQNVLDYEKKDFVLKDTTIVTGYINGKYVITQQLANNKRDRINIFIEYTANDENADIESIRVYSETFVITLESELKDNKQITEKAKSIFRAMNLDMDNPDLGEFDFLGGGSNGFFICFTGEIRKVMFQTYEVDDGSTFVVLARYYKYNDVPNLQFSYYQDGTFEEVLFDAFPTDVNDLVFDDDGFQYNTTPEYSEISLEYKYYLITYKWNGHAFEFESQDEASMD